MTININGTTGISGVDGSAGTPAIQGSDTNTGVFFGTNTIDLSTDGTSRLSIGTDGDLNVDSGTLFVDASTNQVGIGTTSPSEEFVVRADAPSIQLESSNASGRTHGIQSNSDGNFFIYDGTAGVNRITLDSSGNAGIGTTSPDDLLHLSASNSGIGSDFTLANNILRFEDTDITQATGQVIGGFLFEGQDNDTNAAGLQAALTANVAGGTGGGEFRFYTAASGDTLDGSDTERMRIRSDGHMQFNGTNVTTTNGNVGHIYKFFGGANNIIVPFESSGANRFVTLEYRRTGRVSERTSQISIGENTNSQGIIEVLSSGTNGALSGGVRLENGATSWASISDIRLKNVVSHFDNALQDVSTLDAFRFTWKNDASETLQVGLSAQSVQAVLPEATIVSGKPIDAAEDDDTEYLSVRYTEVIPLLVAALQESKERIETLEARLSVLEGGAN